MLEDDRDDDEDNVIDEIGADDVFVAGKRSLGYTIRWTSHSLADYAPEE